MGEALGEIYNKNCSLSYEKEKSYDNSIFSPKVLSIAGLALTLVTIVTIVATPLVIGTAGFAAPVVYGLSATLGVGQTMLAVGAKETEADIRAVSTEVSKIIQTSGRWNLDKIENNNFFGDIKVNYLVRGGTTIKDLLASYVISNQKCRKAL